MQAIETTNTTVSQLQNALRNAGVHFTTKTRKPELIQLAIEYNQTLESPVVSEDIETTIDELETATVLTEDLPCALTHDQVESIADELYTAANKAAPTPTLTPTPTNDSPSLVSSFLIGLFIFSVMQIF